MSVSRFDDFPSGDRTGSRVPQLNVRISPVRSEELLSPPQMASPDIKRQLYEIGHSEKVGLFSYSHPKSDTAGDGVLTIIESSDRHAAIITVTFEEHGTVDIVQALPKPRELTISDAVVAGLVLPIEDIEVALRSALLFYGELIAKLDPWQRQQQFLLNVALTDLGFRTLERNSKSRPSYPMRMPHSNAPLMAYNPPRVIARSDLIDPADEVERATTLIVRKASAQ